MGKLYSFIALFTVGLSFSQTILSQPETVSRTVTDPQEIRMVPGFKVSSAVANPFIAKIGASTDTPTNPTDSNAGSGNPSGTVGTNNFHDTQGNIEVNGGGQLQYTLPVALPPGVKSVAPQINLVYTSGSGNGIAGYGWSISGITSISRTGKTIEKDGEVKGVQLDYSDYYSFNGQRLVLKSGEYGKDGAIYTTEKYSNVIIKSVGQITGQNWQGPEFWEITFEDGSQAWYGATESGTSTARTPLEYNIVKWRDNQGNYITYSYIQESNTNVALISSIEWGGNETMGKSHFNKIDFNYKNRLLFESSYTNGQQFLQGKLLENIPVFSNNKLFKQYNIEYGVDLDISKYEYVKNIKEYNSDALGANPVQFIKPNKPLNIANRQDLSANLISENQKFGDFDGDGRVDLLYYDAGSPGYYPCIEYDDNGNCVQQGDYIEPTSGGTYIVFNKFDGANSPVRVSDEDLSKGIVISGILDNGNKLYTNQGLITYKETTDPLATRKLVLKTYVLQNNVFALIKEKEIPVSSYDNTYVSPPNHGPFEPHVESSTSLGSFKALDINADGISELVFSAKDYVCISDVFTDPNNTSTTNRSAPVGWETRCHDNYRNFIIDLNSSTPANSIARIGLTDNIDNLDFVDFDGDGRADSVSKLDYGISVQSDFKKDANNNYNNSKNIFVGFNGELAGFQYGDFNGDGKLDFAVPEKGVEETTNWRIYINTGTNNFKEQYLPNFLTYRKNPYVGTSGRKREIIYTTFVKDLNNDGKDDFVNVHSETFRKHDLGANRDSSYDLRVKINEGSDYTGNINFRDSYTDHIDSTTPDHFGPINITARVYGIDRFIMIRHGNNALFTYDYFNLPVNYTVNKIVQGGITTEALYNELDAGNNNTSSFYQSNNNLQYPFATLKNIISKAVVTQLKQGSRLQDFRYRDLVSHFQGRGIIGFRQAARSSWYAPGFENTKIWSGSEMDPLNYGAPSKEWSVHTNNENEVFPSDLSVNSSGLISFKQTEYNTQYLINGNVSPYVASPNLVTATVPVKTTEKDFLKNNLIVGTVKYGDYYLPKKTTSNINNGFAVKSTDLTYIHNPSGTGKDYYIGRPESKIDSITVYTDTKIAKEEYHYNDKNLVDSLKTYNRSGLGWLKEGYNYDGFGNVIKKQITNSIDSNKKTDEASYDDKGRFVVSKKDNLGLVTTITYNDWGQILTQTDPLGNILTNTYDGWGKLLTAKTNLGGTTTYTYEKFSNGDTKVIEYSPDGNQKINYTNVLGQNYKSSTKGFAQGSFISSMTVYDVVGRKIKESEPYVDDFDGNTPSQWNTITYDDTVFPAKITATTFTGKQSETSISGNITTTKELNGYGRTNTKTTDALGNVIATSDKGGTINFKYNAAGENIQASYDGNVVKTSYDDWGNKSRFEDPSNGIYTYEYKGYFGAISLAVSPKGKKIYNYNNKGQLITQTETSTDGTNATDKAISFTYNSKGMLTAKSGTARDKMSSQYQNKPFSSYVNFDAYGRVLSSGEESNGRNYMQKSVTYDDKKRITSYEKILYSSGVQTKVAIENVYSSWSGALYQVKDKTSGKILWELQDVNAKGLVKKAQLGGTTIQNTYDTNNFLSNILHTGNTASNTVLSISYSFDAIKNELKSRTTGGDFNILESFDYDDNNRLVNWTDPVTNIKPADNRNVYDVKGRITSNDQIGQIKFDNQQKIYQATGATLNAQGTQNYNNDLIQSIAYNENNDPVYINGVRGDVRFEYGLTSMRQMATYGGNFDVDGTGKFTKYYSEDGSYEVIRNNQTGQEKHLLYIGGTPYESNIVYLKNYTESGGSYKFLHKDYLGSILAITDEAGNKLEQRHFDAWGNLTHLKIGNNATITDKEQIRNYLSDGNLIVDRGYTSHEHFAEVGIIHMNGRLYDPLLRRFLNADENIQDPYNTQNYNKYGYVLNNPLIYSDPSGELFGLDDFLAAVIIGAVVGALTYSAGVLISGDYWNIGSFLKSTIFGAISGAVTFGIGQVFTPAIQAAQALQGFAGAIQEGALYVGQAFAHGFAQGTLSLMQGGTFEQAFVAGALGSLGASAWGIGMKSVGLDNFAHSATGMIGFGALSGGVGSALSGGNFWEGAVIGGVVAGLNHYMHDLGDDIGSNDSDGNSQDDQENPKTNKQKDKEKLEKMKNNPPDHPDYKSPKSGDRKVNHPRGKGWVDKKGNVWIPDDHDGTHAPHWDVQPKKGPGYQTKYPLSTVVTPKTVGYGIGALGTGYIIYKIIVGVATIECGGCGILLTP